MEKVMAFKKWDTKTWVIVALGGVAVVAGAAFVMQSKHAALGRQVHRNVSKFLLDHGSQVHGGIVSGGLVSTPMKTTTAINATVASMLNGYADMLGTAGQAPVGDEAVITGRSGVQSIGLPGAASQGQGQGRQIGAPGPAPPAAHGSSPTRAPASAVVNPSQRCRDDGGFTSPDRKVSTDYDAAEFRPGGSKPPENTDLFAGDGIPNLAPRQGSASAAESGLGGGYE